MERRFTQPTDVELRENEGGGATIAGYAAVFFRADDPGTEYPLFENVRERIAPTAFDRALDERHDVAALFNHNPDNLLGRSASGTLRLSKNRRGLRYEIDLPDTSLGRDLRESVKRGDIPGSSFAFRVTGERWTTNKDEEIREITDVELKDVGPVVYPAYKSTSVGLRDEFVSECRDSLQYWKLEQQRLAGEIAKEHEYALMEATLAGL